MNSTITNTRTKTLTTLLRTSLVIVTLAAASGCGLKGPLILEQVPVDQTQAALENSIEPIPVEAESTTTEESKQATPAE